MYRDERDIHSLARKTPEHVLHDPGINPHLTVNKHALRATQGAGGTDRAADRVMEGSVDTLS